MRLLTLEINLTDSVVKEKENVAIVSIASGHVEWWPTFSREEFNPLVGIVTALTAISSITMCIA